MLLFGIITLMPCFLVGAAVLLGGAWAWGALLYMTALAASMDRLIAATGENADPDAEFPASDALLTLLGVLHFVLLFVVLWGIAGPSGLEVIERVVLGAGAGLVFGQISHPVAHELIHSRARPMRWLGQWIYTSLLAGHHASTHVLIHHVYVGSDRDPNSAPKGEHFYRYMSRVTRQSFVAGLEAETTRRARAGKSPLRHPYVLYVCGGLGSLVAVAAGFGLLGLAAFLSMIVHAQVQIMMADYVQHYGLRRKELPNGRLEPVGPQHSWNAPDMFSSVLMINAPRHSDHHMAPHRAYPALQLDPEEMPYLPYSLPVMGVIALLPKVWFRLMNPLCEAWDLEPGQIGKVRPVGRNVRGTAHAHLAQSRHVQNTSSF